MPDLREQLGEIFQGRVCLVGVGNLDCGDDGFGVHLAQALAKSEIRNPKSTGNPKSETRTTPADAAPWEFEPRPAFGFRISDFGFASVLLAGTSPENCLDALCEGGFDHVVFLDAVEFGSAPGAVVLLGSTEMAARFPQISTHKISLGLLARLVETSGRTRVWLLGAQPQSMKPGSGLSPTLRTTVELLAALLLELPAREIQEAALSRLGRHDSAGFQLAAGRVSNLQDAGISSVRCRLQTGDTAECNSALLPEAGAAIVCSIAPC
jgi:hydrogenase maturation protease